MMVIGMVMGIELFGLLISKLMALSPIWRLGILRTLETRALSLLLIRKYDSFPGTAEGNVFLTKGIARGVIWSLGFAVMAGIAFLALSITGTDPLSMIKQALPATRLETICYFLVGGVLSPVVEELVFRATLYTFFRRWGIFIAVLFSTVLFVLAHKPGHYIPVPQIIGGVVFAVAYELEKNIMVPITIHISGNIAIFLLSIL